MSCTRGNVLAAEALRSLCKVASDGMLPALRTDGPFKETIEMMRNADGSYSRYVKGSHRMRNAAIIGASAAGLAGAAYLYNRKNQPVSQEEKVAGLASSALQYVKHSTKRLASDAGILGQNFKNGVGKTGLKSFAAAHKTFLGASGGALATGAGYTAFKPNNPPPVNKQASEDGNDHFSDNVEKWIRRDPGPISKGWNAATIANLALAGGTSVGLGTLYGGGGRTKALAAGAVAALAGGGLGAWGTREDDKDRGRLGHNPEETQAARRETMRGRKDMLGNWGANNFARHEYSQNDTSNDIVKANIGLGLGSSLGGLAGHFMKGGGPNKALGGAVIGGLAGIAGGIYGAHKQNVARAHRNAE